MSVVPKKPAKKAADKKKVSSSKKSAQAKNFQGTETQPIPKELNKPENNSQMNTCNTTFTPEPTDTTTPPQVVPISCVPAVVAQLEAKYNNLNDRQTHQEEIHQNVLPNGNITHYYNIVPSVIIATITGAVAAFVTMWGIAYFKKNKA